MSKRMIHRKPVQKPIKMTQNRGKKSPSASKKPETNLDSLPLFSQGLKGK